MRNPKLVLTLAVLGVMAIGVAAFVGFGLYAGSEEAKTSLLVRYFRAVSSGDPASVKELTGGSFESDLGIATLPRGSYELYDFGEANAGTVRFLLVLAGDGAEAQKRAILGDMTYKRQGVANRIVSIRRIDEGIRLKE